MKTLTWMLLGCFAAQAPAWSQTPSADWRNCVTLKADAARLACFDSWAAQSNQAAATAAPARASAAAAGPSVNQPSASAPPTERFGLEEKTALQQAADAISSHIPGSFEGWDAKTHFKLANGQVWRVSDGSRAYFPAQDPKVTIRRAALGSFTMEVEGLSRVVKVRRVE